MNQTIGQKLKAVREQKQLTLENVFESTRIRIPHIRALEADDLSSMPSPVQARGYLRNYAEFLGLDLDHLLEEIRSLKQTSGEIIAPADFTTQPTAPTPEPVPTQEQTPPIAPEIDSVQTTESQPEPALTKPKRRGRKKVEPDPLIESQPEMVEEPIIEEPPVIEQPEPVVEEVVGPLYEETQPDPDVSDKVWQTWLNRIGSIISPSVYSKPVDKTLESDSRLLDGESLETQIQESIPALSTATQSDEIFKEIGDELRRRREALSLHLEEVERNTHVKAHYLESLEMGAMDRLPSTVQTRGMLSNYASFLDMDVDKVLLRFADALQARHREKNPQQPARKPNRPILQTNLSLPSFIAGDMVFGIGMAVLLVGFVIWGINRVVTLQSIREIQPTSPSISDVLLASPDPSLFTVTPTLPPVESFGGEATATIVIPTINVNVSVQVNLVAVERTYMRVIVDGKTAFEGRVVPGNIYPFEAEDQVEILVGSGAAIRLAYNGRDLGLMGSFGQVVSNIYRANEIVTPTALPLPTVTSTVPPSPTLRPTLTPNASNTPISSSTPVP